MRRRLGTPALAIASVSVVLTFIGGIEAAAPARLVAIAVVVAGVRLIVGWWSKRRSVPQSWTGVGSLAFAPAAPHEPATPKQVAIALSTAEARELAVSASFGVGLGFCVVMLVLFGFAWAPDWGGNLPRSMELYPIYTHPLAGMIVIAAHRARTRSRRDDTQELFDTCPTDQATRTTGHLLVAWVPGAATLVFLGLLVGLSHRNYTTIYGSVGARQVAALVGAAVLTVGATALGVALARWTPWILAPLVAIIAIGFASVRLATAGHSPTAPVRQLSTWFGEPTVDLRFTAPHWVAHHLWIIALVVLVICLARARDHRGPRLVSVAVVGAVVALASAVLATRPIDTADATRIATMLNNLPDHQVCEVAVTVPVCVFRGDRALARHLAEEMTAVIAAAPAGAVDGWTVRYALDVKVAHLDPEVRSLLRSFPPAERLIPISAVAHRDADEGARLWTALTAVGLHGAPGMNVRGQARGVVALWLATRDLPESQARDMTSIGPPFEEWHPDRQRPWPDPCFAGPTPVRWAETDLEAARRVHALPEPVVRGVVHAQWARLLDPATTTDDLLAALGVEPLGAPRGSTPAPDGC